MPRTLLCVSIMVEDVATTRADAGAARDAGADLVELRLDRAFQGGCDDGATGAIIGLVSELPLACIVTCRPTNEGGEYDGDEASRISLLERLGTLEPAGGVHPPAYIDVELSTFERSANIRQKVALAIDHPEQVRDVSTRLILSHHDFKGRPTKLLDTLARMRDCEAPKVLKLAWTARSLRDNLEVFELLIDRDRPTIALVMGEAGLMSRVLAPKFGGFLTFASLRDTGATAPGQPTLGELLDLYRFRSITSETKVYGVVGWPIGHSLSPHVHNAGFEATGWGGVYLPMPVAPGWEPFKATVLSMLDFGPLDLGGLSVTLPHKEHLVRLARTDTSRRWIIDSLVEVVGAANTLAVEGDGSCRVLNTDVAGITEPLRRLLGAHDETLSGKSAAVIGAGGAARAAVVGLVQSGAHVHVFARRDERAVELAKGVGSCCGALAMSGAGTVEAGRWADLGRCACEVFVNCTPVGMAGGEQPDHVAIPLDQIARSVPEPERITVFDTVYTPIATPLLLEARRLGMRTIEGIEMFVEQAARQFEGWTGESAPRSLFDWVLRETLGESAA